MSVIYDCLIFVGGPSEHEAIDWINKELHEIDTRYHQQFRRVSMDDAGGAKAFCRDVYAGAFNYLGPDQVTPVLLRAPWRYPEKAVVIVEMGDYGGQAYRDDEPDVVTATISDWRAALTTRGMEET